MKHTKIATVLVTTAMILLGFLPINTSVCGDSSNEADVQFKWIDDDGHVWTDADDDGIVPYVPDIEEVPLNIQFQIIKDNSTYFGQENQQQAMENISLLGDALFTGTLDIIPSVTFIDSKTWNVPVTPTMSLNGGEITVTATAWNTTIIETLSIGGNNLNGTIVTITPNEFIFGENQTLTVTVRDATGYAYPNADVYLCYIGDVDGGVPGDPIESHMLVHMHGGGDHNGQYTIRFNTSQQTVNQTLSGFTTIRTLRNISAYVEVFRGGTPTYIYGYARTLMRPSASKIELAIEAGVGVTVSIRNVGDENATGIPFNVSVIGGIFGRINKGSDGVIPMLPADDEFIVEISVFGLGRVDITAMADTDHKTAKGLVLGPFVIILK
jgi:hypothetical protein